MRALILVAATWILAACSSSTSGTSDMTATGSDGMSSMTSMDMAHAGGGGGSCSAFLSCVANCAAPISCITSCRSQVRQSSLPTLMSLVDCACAACLNGSPPLCTTWTATSNNVTCANCQYGKLEPSAHPQAACPTQYQACVNDT